MVKGYEILGDIVQAIFLESSVFQLHVEDDSAVEEFFFVHLQYDFVVRGSTKDELCDLVRAGAVIDNISLTGFSIVVVAGSRYFEEIPSGELMMFSCKEFFVLPYLFQ